VKILIRGGVRFEDFAKIVKGVFVESAIRDGTGTPGEANYSKISMAVGLTRQEIEDEVHQSTRAVIPRPTVAAALSQVLTKWHTESQYLGPYGVPLEIETTAGSTRNFIDLVKSVDPDLDHAVLLDELLRSGTVVRTGERFLKVVSRAFLVPEPMSALMLEYFGNTVTNLTSTLEHNMDRAVSNKRLQRSVFADRGLTDSQIAEFQVFATKKVQELMVELDNWLADAPPPRPGAEPIRDVGVSVFQYIRSRESEPPLKALADKLT
jgi:hypothetical protein